MMCTTVKHIRMSVRKFSPLAGTQTYHCAPTISVYYVSAKIHHLDARKQMHLLKSMPSDTSNWLEVTFEMTPPVSTFADQIIRMFIVIHSVNRIVRAMQVEHVRERVFK